MRALIGESAIPRAAARRVRSAAGAIAALALVAAALAFVFIVSASLGHAQGVLWTHPQRLYSLDISGWRPIRLEPGARELALFAPADPNLASRLCFVHERAVASMANRPQDELNAFARSYAPPSIGNDTVSDLRQVTIDGVVVSAFVRNNPERPSFAAVRVFALSPSGTVVELSCRAIGRLSEAERAQFESTLNSLNFQR